MIIKRKPFSELRHNACSCVGFTMCAFGQVTLCTVYTLHVCPLVVICLPLGLFPFYQLRFAAINTSNQQPKSSITAINCSLRFQEVDGWNLTWLHLRVIQSIISSGILGTPKGAELHYKPFTSMPWKPKDAGVYVLSVYSYNYLLILAAHLCVWFVFVYVFQMQCLSCDFHFI